MFNNGTFSIFSKHHNRNTLGMIEKSKWHWKSLLVSKDVLGSNENKFWSSVASSCIRSSVHSRNNDFLLAGICSAFLSSSSSASNFAFKALKSSRSLCLFYFWIFSLLVNTRFNLDTSYVTILTFFFTWSRSYINFPTSLDFFHILHLFRKLLRF